jgi:DNA-binding winged helix-turn-helix (wHTH) protein
MEDADSLPTGAVISFGQFRLYPAERLVRRHDETLLLGGRALDILITLVEQAGEVVTRQQLISRVWPDVTVVEANLRIHIAGLRKMLGDGREGTRFIVNIPGRGYSFVAPVTRSLGRQPSPSRETTGGDQLEKLPPRLTRMIGRDETIRIVSAQLMMWRFVSIVGAGGMGKTTVAISVARALLDGFNGAVFFIDLAALTDAELVPIAVASALGFMVQTQDPVPSLLTYIGDKKILLVLDNCEHVIDVAAPLAERVINEAPQAHVLTTSREALRVQGEHVHLLHALDYPPDDAHPTATEALRYPAVERFMERAAASGHSSELSDADAPS